MGSPERPLDVEMGDMSAEGKLKPSDVDIKPDQKLLEKNGEVKEPEQERFTGLKKEELLKISSQPNWVRARWALFIIFWIIWFAMLIGAILIVINAPRCKPEPKQQWYKDNIAYEVNPKEFAGGIKGMKDHLPYIFEYLHSKIIVMSGVTNNENLATIPFGNFSQVVKSIHEKEGKVLIDMVVDSLPENNNMFQLSSRNCSKNPTADYCDMFVWKNGNNSMAGDGWKYSEERKALYKVNAQNNPVVDFSSSDSLPFFKAIILDWFNRYKIDGVKIRDVSKLHNITEKQFVSSLWEELFQDNETLRALYVYSSSPDPSNNPVSLSVNDSNTEHSPVYLTSQISDIAGKAGAGSKIKKAIEDWRLQSRSVGGFVVSPLTEPLAAARLPHYAAGLNLLSMSLPGLPILRSGDELSATSPNFTWKKSDDLRDSYPLNGSKEIRMQTKELIVKRVDGIQAKQSLRYDTRDADTTFEFLDIDNEDVVAFKRKWDQKSAVLVVSNLSPNNHTVDLQVKNGLMSKKNLAEKAKVLVISIPSVQPKEVKLKEVNMISGLTLILET